MTQEQKDLLLKDLCARLPYGVICDMWFERNESNKITEVLKCGGLMRLMNSEFNFMVKPYLRPMESMTEEQQKEFDQLIGLELKAINDEIAHTQVTAFEVDFYNKNHFDYRGLIDKGLAIDATGLNIY